MLVLLRNALALLGGIAIGGAVNMAGLAFRSVHECRPGTRALRIHAGELDRTKGGRM